MQVKIKLEQDLVTYIEMLFYEIQMNEEVMQKIITDAALQKTKGITSSEAFKEYQQETMTAKIKYEKAIQNVKDTILAPLNGHQYDFSIDFRQNMMTLNINCECGEKIYKERMAKEWK